jgi:hypothetical protein
VTVTVTMTVGVSVTNVSVSVGIGTEHWERKKTFYFMTISNLRIQT